MTITIVSFAHFEGTTPGLPPDHVLDHKATEAEVSQLVSSIVYSLLEHGPGTMMGVGAGLLTEEYGNFHIFRGADVLGYGDFRYEG